jgi:hypothetical protein
MREESTSVGPYRKLKVWKPWEKNGSWDPPACVKALAGWRCNKLVEDKGVAQLLNHELSGDIQMCGQSCYREQRWA